MFGQVVLTEFLKLRRSKVPWFSLAAISMGPLGIALFMWILLEPDRAAQLGLLGAKASLSGLAATWPAFFSMLVLIVGIGGMLLLSFIVAFVFGREYAEGTAKNLLALPVGRPTFVIAKFVVAAAWWLALVVAVIVEALAVGGLLGLPGFSVDLAAAAVSGAVLAAGIAYLLAPVVAWITVLGRGYMAPIGFSLAMLAVGNVLSKTGWGVWFPWSIVPTMVGMVGSPVRTLPPGSYVVLALTFVGGVALTIVHLVLADNDQ
jgi:ABC-2 type transport system permease protein